MAPGPPQAPPASRQATHLPAVQDFYVWIKDVRVATSPNNDLDDFIPAGAVQAYLREDPSRLTAIFTALFGSEDSRWRGRTSEIVNWYSVVFAILVSIGYGNHILNFLGHETVCDEKLPFEVRPNRFPYEPSDSYEDEMFDRFQKAQLRFCAVKFHRNSTNEFDDSRPLPFLSKELIDEGGSAKVYKVEIHGSHDMLQSSSTEPSSTNGHKFYALKAYDKHSGKRWYDIETNAFKKLRDTGLESTHMVGYHCSYTHRGRHYALLEYADMKTLEDFMEHQRPPSMDDEILAFWRSILHVVEAIAKIHDLDPNDGDENDPFRFIAVHQDIKPKNILTKSKPNVSIYEYAFGLADLGTSSLMAAQSKRLSRDNFGTKAYGAPECFRSDSWEYSRDIKITPRVDVWSFACVLSELCVWVVFGYRGPHGVEGYRSRRELHNQATPGAANCFHHKGKLSTAVLQEHKTILKQHRCDDTTREVLRALPKMLQIDPSERWSAKVARDHFKQILHRADMAMASPNRGSQSGELPVRQEKTPSRSTTVSSDTSSPLLPHKNPRLSTAKEGTQRDASAGASPKFDQMLTQTPRNMTMNSDMGIDSFGSSGVTPGPLGLLMQQAFQNTPPGGEAPSAAMHSPALPDRTRQSNALKDSKPEERPPALMSPFQDAGQRSINQPQSPQLDTSHRKRNTQSTSNPPAAATTDHASPEDRPKPVQDPEPTAAPEPSIPPTPPARLSFRDAQKWRTNARAQRSAAQLSNHHLLRYLEGRDHVFVVDDGSTMRDLRTMNRQQGQAEVADYVDVLGYMVKRHDKDGIDLYYFNSSERVENSKNSTKLAMSVRGHKFSGVSSPENSLVKKLDAYSKKIKAFASGTPEEQPHGWKSHLPFTPSKPPRLPDPLSVYVLTDGVWQLGGHEDLENTIRDLIKNLNAAKCTRKQIGIQFIRFGNDPAGIERLNALDRLGRTPGLNLDIVDTEPVENGNVWKMLLGAIDKRFDAD